MAPSLDGPGAGPPQALGPFLWLMEFRLLVGCQGIPEMMQPDADDVFKRKRPPTEAALLPDRAALFTHQRIVSVKLASKSRPAAREIFQSLGFSLTLR
jgi:hypothetical protein